MRRLFSIIALSVALLPLTVTAHTIADFFASEPGEIFALLTRTHRLDMVDYYRSGQQVAIQNNMEGASQLLEMDSTYLKLQSSAGKVVEMRMRLAGKDTVITVIETVMAPVPDSRLTQWNTHWQQYTSDRLFAMPGIDDFIVKKMNADTRADLQAVMLFPLVQLTFKGDNHDIIEATHGLEQFLAPSEYKRFAEYFKPSIRYRFDGLKIKRVKK